MLIPGYDKLSLNTSALSFIEYTNCGVISGEYYENEEFDFNDEDALLYAPSSPDTLLDYDLAMLDMESREHHQAEPVDEILMDPILGPLVCALNTEDSEVPIVDDVLPLPLGDPTLNYSSDGGLRDGYFLDCPSPDDEADLPSSPSEFHVYEEWESSDALRNHVRPLTLPKLGCIMLSIDTLNALDDQISCLYYSSLVLFRNLHVNSIYEP